MFIPPIPIWAWEIDLSESWLNGICDHAPDEDHMGSEHIYFIFTNCYIIEFLLGGKL